MLEHDAFQQPCGAGFAERDRRIDRDRLNGSLQRLEQTQSDRHPQPVSQGNLIVAPSAGNCKRRFEGFYAAGGNLGETPSPVGEG